MAMSNVTCPGGPGPMQFHPNATVNLNVGGTKYTTTASTLTHYPKSLLGGMFCGRLPVNKDENGCYFIEGDGQLFRYVLHFLRRSRLVLPATEREIEMLLGEAEYYQIEPMIREIELARAREEEILEVDLYDHMTWVLRGRRDTLESVTGDFQYDMEKQDEGEVWMKDQGLPVNRDVNKGKNSTSMNPISSTEIVLVYSNAGLSPRLLLNKARSSIFSKVFSLGFKEVPVLNRFSVQHDTQVPEDSRLWLSWRFMRSVNKV